jgi:hypothetical protein
MASDYPRCEFLNLERKEIQGSFTKSHSDLKRLQQKKPLSANLSTMS